MKEVVFFITNLSDIHFIKRVEEFVKHGYSVKVYGFKRKESNILLNSKFTPLILSEIHSENYKLRIPIYRKTLKSVAKECEGKLCYYSSFDIAFFATKYINSPYIYEVCDLVEQYISNSLINSFLKKINERIVKRSAITLITSDGFREYFHNVPQEKMYLVANKVAFQCPPYLETEKTIEGRILKIGFVGIIRSETTYNIAKICLENIGKVELHLFGRFSVDPFATKLKKIAEENNNIYYHGPFENPKDLPSIYSQIDLVLAAYKLYTNVKYAEPNKLYEAIYFRCPIVVSDNTFLGKKVSQLGIGYVIDAMDEDSIRQFLQTVSPKEYSKKFNACRAISQESCIDNYDDFFTELRKIC